MNLPNLFSSILNSKRKLESMAYLLSEFTGDEINNFYKTTVNDQLAVLHFKEQEKFGEPINALKMVRDVFYSAK